MKQKVMCMYGTMGKYRNTLFFQIVCVFLTIALLLCGCASNATDSDTNRASSATETNMETASQDPMVILQQWLKKDCSFTLSYQYMNLAINGMSQETVQTFAADGGWSFTNHNKIWDHTTDYEVEEKSEFYYRYENSKLICYSIINGNKQQRAVLTDKDRKAMDDSKACLIGVPGLLPDYLQDWSVSHTDTEVVFTYSLPVEKVLADSTLLSVYTQNVFSLSHYEYQSTNKLLIGCTLKTDSKTYRPISLSFDFSQLKPYVLSDGALSGEQALNSDFMTMEYTFDYNFQPTITIPGKLIS